MSLEIEGFEFERFFLDSKEKILLRDSKPFPITPKTFQLLHLLVENHGHIVEKEEIMQKVWSDSFVEDSNLTFSISQLRKILEDDAQNPHFIETIPRRGYRFIAETLEKTSDSTAVFNNGLPENEPLAAMLEKKETFNDSKKPKTVRYYLLWSSVVAVLLLGFAGFYWWFGEKNSVRDRQFNFQRLTSNGNTKLAAISPDGKFIAYIIDEQQQESIWLKNIAAGSEVKILPSAETVGLTSLTFSPDSNYVYYIAQNTLFQLSVLGGTPKKLSQNISGSSQHNEISFSPDGNQFAFIRHSTGEEEIASVIIANTDGTDERVLATSKRPDIFLGSAAWSPDGKVIAIRTSTEKGNKIVTARVKDGVVSPISSSHWSIVSQIVWQPGGNSLLVIATEGRSSISHQIWSLSYPGGEAKNITNDLNNYLSISLTSNGQSLIALRLEQTAHIWVMSGEESNQAKELTNGIDRYDGIFGLKFLSNGKIIYETTPNGKGEVWMMDADGSNAKKIVDESGATTSSPDGNYIVFQSDDDQGVGLFRLNMSNGEKKRLTTGTDVWATFSPDEKWVIFTRWAEQVALWKVSIDGGEAVKLTNFPDLSLAPDVSPDGKFIAFYLRKRDRKKTPEIVIIPFDGGEIIRSFNLPIQYQQGFGKNALQWTPDGQAIRYSVLQNNISNIWEQPIDGNPPTQVTNFTDRQIFNFSYSPNGKQIALSRGTFNRDVILIKDAE